MNQILNHMGHTWDVHRDFYRQYDSVGERLDVAKLIMLQDQNKLNEYRDKSLSGIDVERLAEAQFKGKECAEHVCICRTVETLVWVHSFSPLNGVCYIFLDIVKVPQRPLPPRTQRLLMKSYTMDRSSSTIQAELKRMVPPKPCTINLIVKTNL